MTNLHSSLLSISKSCKDFNERGIINSQYSFKIHIDMYGLPPTQSTVQCIMFTERGTFTGRLLHTDTHTVIKTPNSPFVTLKPTDYVSLFKLHSSLQGHEDT